MPIDQRFDAAFLGAILDHIAHPVFVKDREFRFVFLNRALCELVGHPREAMLGKTDYDFFPKEESDFFRKKDVEMFKTGREVEIDEEWITGATGVRHLLATTKVPLGGKGAEVTHLVGIIHDITRLKNAEDALRAANEQLEERVADRTRELADAQQSLLRKERLAVLGRLVGSLAHQIRNPLGAVINAAAILDRTLGDGAHLDARKALQVIHEEAWAANRIILDLLDYARVRPAEARPISLEALVRSVLRAEQLSDVVRVNVDISPELELLADRDQSEGAIRNLIRNAIEAMPGGGTLTLSAGREADQGVLVIEDTGPGISLEVQAHLFEPLITTKALGIGLGLTTARALVENQRGSIRVSSQPGKGARFEVRLPLARA